MKKIIFYKGFPLTQYTKLESNTLPNTIVLGIGGNQGKVAQTFLHLIAWFSRNARFCLIQTTPIYQNPPFGYTQQPDFYNAIIVLKTSLDIVTLFGLIFYLERRFGRGRKRAFKNAPRTLDIDIIFYNQLILKRPYLTIPHKDYQNRASVLIPMILQAKR